MVPPGVVPNFDLLDCDLVISNCHRPMRNPLPKPVFNLLHDERSDNSFTKQPPYHINSYTTWQSRHLERELSLLSDVSLAGVFKHGGHGVGELLIVVVYVFPSDSCHTGRMCFNAQSPAGNVDLMDTVIPGQTRDGVSAPPSLVRALCGPRPCGSRTLAESRESRSGPISVSGPLADRRNLS